MLVSKRQEGNPLLKFMRNVRWQWADIVPDYQMGPACALFLSLRRAPRTVLRQPLCTPRAARPCLGLAALRRAWHARPQGSTCT